MTAMNSKAKRLWDRYSKEYNELSDKLSKAGIDTQMLKSVIEHRVKFEICDIKDRISTTIKNSCGV
jgi:uncharacterized protein YdcH (DUF465 family)